MIERKEQIPSREGMVVRIKGRYRVTNIAPHKIIEKLPDGTLLASDQTVSLEMVDGFRVRVGPRPEEERKRLEGRMVVVVGVIHHPAKPDDERAAQPDPVPTLMRISAVRLITGE